MVVVVVCTVSLIHGVMMMGGRTIYHSWDKRRGGGVSYSSIVRVVAVVGNLPLQYVNSIICTLRFGLGVKKGLALGGAPRMHGIFGLSRVGNLHFGI